MITNELDIRDYHESPNVSNSKLKTFLSSPLRYKLKHLDKVCGEQKSAALTLGAAFDCMVFDGDAVFDKRYAVCDQSLTTKAGKAWKAEQDAAGKEILKRCDYELFKYMHEAIADNDVVAEMTAGASSQTSLLADWPGLPGMQSRPDWWVPLGCPTSDFRPCSLDLKTTSNLRGLINGGGAYDYGYIQQAAIVRMCARLNGVPDVMCFLIGVEKCFAPQAVVIEIPDAILDRAERDVRGHLDRLAKCYETGRWPRSLHHLVEMGTPWVYR